MSSSDVGGARCPGQLELFCAEEAAPGVLVQGVSPALLVVENQGAVGFLQKHTGPSQGWS